MKMLAPRWIAALLVCGLAPMVNAADDSLTHVVRRGETLSSISRKYYGDARRWDRIVAANSLVNPDRLREGQELVIPVGDAPAPPPAVAAPPPSVSTGDGTRPAGPVPPVAAAPPVQASQPAVAALDSDALRRLAAEAVVQHYTNLNLSAYDPGYLVRLESPTPGAGARVVVSWLGREALALKKGATPDIDRKQVLKIEVWLTEDGRVVKIGDRPVWLGRNAQTVSAP
jgi:LysM repeat protein